MGATAAISTMAVSSGVNAYTQSQNERAQGDYASAMYKLNARMAEFQAADALSRGETDAAATLKKGYKGSAIIRRSGKQTAGAQKVALAAQGIDINTGSAKETLADTEAMSEIDQIEIQRSAELDALTIKNNAVREAWGFKTQASNYASEGDYAIMAAKNKARSTLINGGLQALSYGLYAYGNFKKNNPGGLKTDKVKPPKSDNSSRRSYSNEDIVSV